MLSASELTRAGALDADAIDAAHPDPATLASALAGASTPEALAAVALIAGRIKATACVPALIALLGREGLPGKAAAWALGHMDGTGGELERQLLSAIAAGGLDTRENGYQALAMLGARGQTTPTLPGALRERVRAEIERAKAGGSGLGEHACRALAVLGDPEVLALVQQVSESDRFCDRFELQRLRKAVEENGRDGESQRLFTGPWRAMFADHLFTEPVAAPPAPSGNAKPTGARSGGARPASPQGPGAVAPAGASPPATGPEAQGEGEADQEGGQGAAPAPIDWTSFVASPEAKTLPAPVQQLASQLGPLLEQLAIRAIRAALTDLSGQELVALLLQVLPQALPPQHVQMALSPQALNAYQAIAKYLLRTGLASHGAELVDAVKLVRRELSNQRRQSGILGGPDYSDPDELPAAGKPPVQP